VLHVTAVAEVNRNLEQPLQSIHRRGLRPCHLKLPALVLTLELFQQSLALVLIAKHLVKDLKYHLSISIEIGDCLLMFTLTYLLPFHICYAEPKLALYIKVTC